MLAVGTHKVLIYGLRQYYYERKVIITNLKKVYVKSFTLSHARSIICIIFVSLIYPQIHDFIYSIAVLLTPIMGCFLYVENLFIPYRIGPLYATPNTPSPSFSMQLGLITHSINFGLDDLSRLNLKFEEQFDKAIISRNTDDIALAREYRKQISELRERLLFKIREREDIANRATSFRPDILYKSFNRLSEFQTNILDMSQTYVNREN